MKKCQKCGTPIKPFYNLCYNCWQERKTYSKGNGRIPDPISARNFMQHMGINGGSI